jgi:glutamate-1-semialdehyde 2,1-aminomutase
MDVGDATAGTAEGTNSRIVAEYRRRTPRSAALFREAAELLPSGIAHDARRLHPYGIYVERAAGAHKWDVDGNRYIDFFGGHGALILGHCHPRVTAAVTAALQEGTQFGANHPREVAWARAIQRLVPSAERLRFTSSGTEATLMAVRLARAFTGRDTLLRFAGHFHGWQDHMTHGYSNHFDGSPTAGVLPAVAEKAVVLPPGDAEAVAATLRSRDDICAVILEPTGSSFGQVPLGAEFAQSLRELTRQAGVLLIFDEVITGFRCARGGAQELFGVRPDLSTFAKIVAGGMPGGVVAGRREILDLLDFDAAAASGHEKIGHPGTFNANPVSAAAGTACLSVLAETDANAVADARASELRAGLNAMLAAEGLPWAVYGTSSGFHLFTNPAKREGVHPLHFDPRRHSMEELKGGNPRLVERLRLALLVCGVDTNPRLGGLTSAAHSAADIDETIAAWREAIHLLRAENELPA